MTTTGKAILIDNSEFIAVISFSEDRTDANAVWLRYLSVRDDYQNEGIGPRLLRSVTRYLLGDATTVRIAVNNPFAYVAAHKAGFVFTGDTTGLAELILEYPSVYVQLDYMAGLAEFREADHISSEEVQYIERKQNSPPPRIITNGFPVRSHEGGVYRRCMNTN